MSFDADLFVIGGGSGGVRAARIAAAEHGCRVHLADASRMGGTCVIRGCVPKKLLVYGAHFAEDLKDAQRFGWNVPDGVSFDWSRLKGAVLGEVDRLNAAYTDTLQNNGVEIIHSRAEITGPHMEPPELSNATTYWRCAGCGYESIDEHDLSRASFHAHDCARSEADQ